ncbi:MAG: TrmB family transcriptional regulator [Clostridia bacterium]|nr:TrmB family transcriptional regulator [Clostridia bacterium]
MNLVECLVKTGLTRQESELYIALCREGEMTGYEAAKVTGISRSNAYQALAGLVDKGGAYIVEGAVPRYSAVPVEEYCANVMRGMEEIVARIRRDCPTIREASDSYITIYGLNRILDKMKNIIQNAKERIYVSLSENELVYFRKELLEAVGKGLKVVIITSGPIDVPGATVHTVSKRSGQVRLIADSAYVLTGEISNSENDICLYSQNKPLIELLKESLTNEIKLAELGKG